jgi:hypothetical protein
MTVRAFAQTAALLLLAGVVGCDGGPKRYPVAGAVTVGGRPVPTGEVVFEPDSAKGNNGPGSVARIKDGRYETDPDKGVIGGAYVVRITPFDGVPFGDSTDGKPLLRQPHVENVELAAGENTKDFAIPEPKGR